MQKLSIDVGICDPEIDYQELYPRLSGTTLSLLNDSCNLSFRVNGYTLGPDGPSESVSIRSEDGSVTIPSNMYNNSDGVSIDYRLRAEEDDCNDPGVRYFRFNGIMLLFTKPDCQI